VSRARVQPSVTRPDPVGVRRMDHPACQGRGAGLAVTGAGWNTNFQSA
jgi:hypothetical protein